MVCLGLPFRRRTAVEIDTGSRDLDSLHPATVATKPGSDRVWLHAPPGLRFVDRLEHVLDERELIGRGCNAHIDADRGPLLVQLGLQSEQQRRLANAPWCEEQDVLVLRDLFELSQLLFTAEEIAPGDRLADDVSHNTNIVQNKFCTSRLSYRCDGYESPREVTPRP